MMRRACGPCAKSRLCKPADFSKERSSVSVFLGMFAGAVAGALFGLALDGLLIGLSGGVALGLPSARAVRAYR